MCAALAACAHAVPTRAAKHATDPVCATVILTTPDDLGGGLTRRDTTAQATTAWGDPAIVLRCGIEPLGPTTDKCQRVETPGGPTIDWVVVASDPDDEQGSDWTFTTYGRVPAVQVTVPAEVARTHPSSLLDKLGPAIAKTEQRRECV